MFRPLALVAATTLAAPAFADGHASGDAAAGEKAFRQCISCHVVVNDEGETLAGRKAKTGPNLYGVAGRALGAVEDFKYSDIIMLAGEQGVVYD
ncbi:MAG: c-type cytochrome, partial [Pseudomonadota bacterium]